MFELKDLSELKKEVFGPVLHIVRYKASELDELIDGINEKGYALTHGIHSRIENTIRHITSRIEAGNVYINRNIVGAVVGVQPFGGHGLSGTGPKAGGPFYLQKLSRLGGWNTPALDTLATINKPAIEKLLEIAPSFGLSEQELTHLRLIAESRATYSLHRGQVVLTGPTGETNTLSWHAPKSVWLYGGTLAQAMMVLITLAGDDCKAVITTESPLAPHTGTLANFVVLGEKSDAQKNHIIVALSEVPVQERIELAELDGAIRRIIDAQSFFDMARLYDEISQSYNTTAAGGNASLMAQA